MINTLSTAMLIIPVLLAVAFLTLLERKVMGHVQARKGPNIVGPSGLLQPFADGINFFIKEPMKPLISTHTLFLLMPIMALMLALTLWTIPTIPISLLDINLTILFFLAISSLAVYPLLGSGWASNSKYALLGALRAVAQTISYEVSLALIVITTTILAGGFSLMYFNTTQEEVWLILPVWPLAMMWYVSTLAETNRSPFDLAEGESELVSGFNVEYAGGTFALFFLAEYSNILLMNILTVILFLGPSLTAPTISLKLVILVLSFLWVRSSYPRLRYDQLMHLMWKGFLPLTLSLMLFNLALINTMTGIPPM
uniref:NADH-ubiquinone oxidoreductase chain 1 n=1 Tax=Batrachomoeus trispinosus TaxID=262770 RepID=Q5GMA5_9TELE|nr:NADH dehydrogenase subunit 1 [Batrachomoeus trispinosus]